MDWREIPWIEIPVWIQIPTLIIMFAGLFIWNSIEHRATMKRLNAALEAERELMKTFHQENQKLISSIGKDIKDPHG